MLSYDILTGMRKNRVIEHGRCYHLISRLAHRAFFLDDEEKTRAVKLLGRVEEFSGVIVLAYAFMTNHFHIFIYVPEAEEINEDEILRRIKVLYCGASLEQVLQKWNRLKEEEARMLQHAVPTEKYVSRFSEYKASFVRRMWNSAEFMRTYKQHFTMSFNGRRDHSGTMFEGRYHERNHLPESSIMWKTAAYIDINPWKAGIVGNAVDYEWCSFFAAAKGDERARRGYYFMYGNDGDWETVRECHELSMRDAMAETLARREAEKIEREELAKRGIVLREKKATKQSKTDPGLERPRSLEPALAGGNREIAERILELLRNGPMKPALLRAAVGIASRTHFNRYYLVPMLQSRLIAQTCPEVPNSPRQEYRLR